MKKCFAFLIILVRFPSMWTKETFENEDGKHDAVFKVYNNFEPTQSLKDIIFNSEVGPQSSKQLPFTNPCSCENFKCSCCAGIRIIGFGFDRLACAEMTYQAAESKVDLNVMLNNASIYSNRLSTNNRQVCVPIIPVTLVGPFDICVRMYDMNVVEQRLHACLAMMGRVSQYPVVVLQFSCMEMGPGGVGLTRPIGGNYNESAVYPSENFTIPIPTQEDSDIFDAIFETPANNSVF